MFLLRENRFSQARLLLVVFLTFSFLEGFSQDNFEAKFVQLKPRKAGVSFKNQLTENQINNILRYEYFYNGGGVAVGDLDNDGLDDIFFTGNMVPNQLYKNLGELKFENVTKSAGVKGKSTWTTGVSMADVNGDGLLDIYVCYSGKGTPESRKNELWINEGDFQFSEQAEEYGIADPSNSTQGLFFDFDQDGDLDLFLLNHHIEVINELEFDEAKSIRHPYAGDKFYRNDNGKFTDISEEAGIKGSALGFGLAVIASDINQDGWLDLLVTNDYIEPDYVYINQQDGTFSDEMESYFSHISHFSMGADIADINNDGLQDILTLDMLPEDNKRQKLLYGPENYEQYALMIRKGFYHQNMRNMLHLNLGEGNFSEIGQLAGISNTDWSWAALFFDATNDGFKDLFVTNGYYRDYTNRDFLKYKGDYYFKQAVANQKADTLHLVTTMSSTPVHNYFFENRGDLQFKDQSLNWGFEKPGFSSGAAYSDLDNDGDLDLVVNHLNEVAGIYENTGEKGNWVQIKLTGTDLNPLAIGSRIEIFSDDSKQVQELQPVRGFQSSSTYRLHFGLGAEKSIDSVLIHWPYQSQSTFKDLDINSLNTFKQKSTSINSSSKTAKNSSFKKHNSAPQFLPKASGFNDFKRQPLMITMPSAISPVLAQGDLNQDGIPEIFIGGTKGQAAQIFSFDGERWNPYSGFSSADEFTDAIAIFEDFNGDGFEDLFIGSGGYHDYLRTDESLVDRLYLNDGTGRLRWSNSFPDYTISTGTAISLDINQDGAPDLFVGGRIIPGRYPQIPESKILINNGQGQFTDQTDTYIPNSTLGMVTSAQSQDLNDDGYPDLILVGEFMPITAFINQQGKSFLDQSEKYFSDQLSGWWSSLAQADLDGDGDLDLIVGNFGENSQFEVSEEKKLRLFSADFDQNGSIDPILECYIGDGYYPFASRDELLDQMVSMRSKFTDYESYSTAKISDLFSQNELDQAEYLEANTMSSFYLENSREGFRPHKLPTLAQAFPIYAIQVTDVNRDGIQDLVLGGNNRQSRIRVGNLDAGFGLVLQGKSDGGFEILGPADAGFSIKGDIKSILEFQVGEKKFILFGVHGQALELYEYVE
ncbi:VCBS repeat-containing protein [Algoriphagus hitonicola]|uniref:Repeat domain-containing protein n=1 Tax=Algoriphagus hitonicola TaxID=435880 RepID=A0A1I2VU80_9BACT|nr:VCBS repeat-containing protein [Algoriphagus hitonicola]SFG91126.1 Repeat domain-containing protein [Algoriphagus hitonicola]